MKIVHWLIVSAPDGVRQENLLYRYHDMRLYIVLDCGYYYIVICCVWVYVMAYKWIFWTYQTDLLVLILAIIHLVIISTLLMIIRNLIVLIFCQSTICHPYNIVTILTLRYLIKDMIIFDFVALSPLSWSASKRILKCREIHFVSWWSLKILPCYFKALLPDHKLECYST